MSNSVNEYVEKYYNNFQENAKGEIEGSIKDFITDSIQDYLVDRGYGRSNAEAIVDFITSNNQNIDYSHMLDIKEDSPLYAKLADMEIFDSIEKLRDFTNTLNKAVGTYDLCLKMDEDIQKNGKCDAEDLKSLLSTILDSTENIANSMPGSNIFSSTALQTLKEYMLDGVDEIIEISEKNYIYNFILNNKMWNCNINGNDYGEVFMNLFDGNYENGPSVEELLIIYEKYGDKASALDPYLEWRVAYEFRLSLEEQGIDVEDYFNAVEELTDDRSWIERFFNFIGFETDNLKIFDLLNNDNSKDMPIEDISEQIDKSIDSTNLPEHEKERLKEQMKKIFCTDEIKTATVESLNNVRSSFTSAATARRVLYDPIILDLDGDGTVDNGIKLTA